MSASEGFLSFLPAEFNRKAANPRNLTVWSEWKEFDRSQLMYVRQVFRKSVFMQTAFARITDKMFSGGISITETTPVFEPKKSARFLELVNRTWRHDFLEPALLDLWLYGFTHAIYNPHSEFGACPVGIDMLAVRMEYRTTPTREFEWRIAPSDMSSFGHSYIEKHTHADGSWNVPLDFAFFSPPRVYTWHHRKPLFNGLLDSLVVAAIEIYENKRFNIHWYQVAIQASVAPVAVVSRERAQETKIAVHATDISQAMLPKCTVPTTRQLNNEEKRSLNAGTLHTYLVNRGGRLVESDKTDSDVHAVKFYPLAETEKLERPIPIGAPPNMTDFEIREAEQICALFGMPWNRMSASSTKKTLIQSQPHGEDSSDDVANAAENTWSSWIERIGSEIYMAMFFPQLVHQQYARLMGLNNTHEENEVGEDSGDDADDEGDADKTAASAATATTAATSLADGKHKKKKTPKTAAKPHQPSNQFQAILDKLLKEDPEELNRATDPRGTGHSHTAPMKALQRYRERMAELKSECGVTFGLTSKVKPAAVEALYSAGKMTDKVYGDYYSRIHHIPRGDILDVAIDTSVSDLKMRNEERSTSHAAEAKEKAKAKHAVITKKTDAAFALDVSSRKRKMQHPPPPEDDDDEDGESEEEDDDSELTATAVADITAPIPHAPFWVTRKRFTAPVPIASPQSSIDGTTTENDVAQPVPPPLPLPVPTDSEATTTTDTDLGPHYVEILPETDIPTTPFSSISSH